jgi:hypothetical protein
MLIIRNYLCGNNYELLSGDFILEIIEGNIVFRNHQENIQDGKCIGCNVKFEMEFDGSYQLIKNSYTYLSERLPIYQIDLNDIDNIVISDESSLEDQLNEIITLNTSINVKVNRIGDYNLSVKAYNYYNQVFYNNYDKTISVHTSPINIETIINSEFVNNYKDFKDKNVYGELLSDNDKQLLFLDISVNSKYPLSV